MSSSFTELLAQTKATETRYAAFPGEPLRDQFSIFQPILEGKIHTILTWNIGEVWRFKPVVSELNSLKRPLLIIIGYGSFTATDTYERVLNWKKEFPQFTYKLARNMHTKLWVGDSECWVGSANFVPNMVTNLMVKVPKDVRDKLIPLIEEGEYLSKSTNPKLITTKRKTLLTTSKILLQ
jgi:hypothetical protein